MYLGCPATGEAVRLDIRRPPRTTPKERESYEPGREIEGGGREREIASGTRPLGGLPQEVKAAL